MTEKKKVTSMFAFVSTDDNDGNEGILACLTPGGVLAPMCGNDRAIIPRMVEHADELGLNYTIKYFVEVPDARHLN